MKNDVDDATDLRISTRIDSIHRETQEIYSLVDRQIYDDISRYDAVAGAIRFVILPIRVALEGVIK
jgi:hypothetical protein